MIEVTPEQSLIVELIAPDEWDVGWNPTWESTERDDTLFHLLIGDIVELVYYHDWMCEEINDLIDVGTIIEFYCATYGDVTDVTQDPFVVRIAGINIYAEGADTVVEHLGREVVIYRGIHRVFSQSPYN